jgi:hypothetical protein
MSKTKQASFSCCDNNLPIVNFSKLTQQAIWGAQLNLSEQIIATHQELAMLRRCASQALDIPNHVVHVISSSNKRRVDYLVKTLIHLGVSCGNIIVSKAAENHGDPEGMWIFVENIAQAS